MKYFIAIFIAMFQSTLYAGGDFFPIIISSVDIDGNDFTFIAKPVVENRKWMDPECKQISVSGTYDSLRWIRYSSPMSRDSHRRSLGALRESKVNNSVLYFGYIGRGLIEVSACKYESKGLMHEQGNVYSIYHHI